MSWNLEVAVAVCVLVICLLTAGVGTWGSRWERRVALAVGPVLPAVLLALAPPRRLSGWFDLLLVLAPVLTAAIVALSRARTWPGWPGWPGWPLRRAGPRPHGLHPLSTDDPPR